MVDNRQCTSIVKSLALAGTAHVEFRVEAFNIFNQANFGQPGRVATIGSTTFGVIANTRFRTGDSGSARQVRFAIKALYSRIANRVAPA
jgi:hypothetical protein